VDAVGGKIQFLARRRQIVRDDLYGRKKRMSSVTSKLEMTFFLGAYLKLPVAAVDDRRIPRRAALAPAAEAGVLRGGRGQPDQPQQRPHIVTDNTSLQQ